MNETEQQYQAELLRTRQRDQRARAEEAQREMELGEQENLAESDGAGLSKAKHKKRFPISPIEVGLWLFPAMALDTFEFFGQALAAIPVVGWALAGASSVVGAVFSGIMFLVIGLWLLMKQVTPFTPDGMKIFLVLGGTTFGNAMINWLPAWSGFFLWLFFKAHMQAFISPGKKK